MKTICKDLLDEYQALDDLVSGLDTAAWDTLTPFAGWTVKDEISHIAYFDQQAVLSVLNPEIFRDHLDILMHEFVSFEDLYAKINAVGGRMSCSELLGWWRHERSALLEAYNDIEGQTRLPWYGPPMSARSSATARLMETWAHGQDIADALHVRRKATDRLKHIAHLGYSTYVWSFVNRGLSAPKDPVRLELKAPSGELWTWGDDHAANRVTGDAEDFCLVVTQRRHVNDTTLETTGETAHQWMLIAQAFAGPPEEGPQPGSRCVH
jgi:uncharacterized protein (TIGR03084 family)